MTKIDINISTFTTKQIDTFWANAWIGDEEYCWHWKNTPNHDGYGRIMFKGVRYFAHCVAYLLFHGTINKDLTIDHLCRNEICINPSHLEEVPHRINVLRGTSPFARKARQVACLRGHLFTPENTMNRGDGRRCLTCHKEHMQAYQKTEKSKKYHKNYRANKKKSK